MRLPKQRWASPAEIIFVITVMDFTVDFKAPRPQIKCDVYRMKI
jgi:hypothetical protein